MRCSPPLATTASIFTARLRGKKTIMSPFPEASCEAPASCTVIGCADAPPGKPLGAPPDPWSGTLEGPLEGPLEGLIHAVIVLSAVAACTAPATRVRQMLPPLDSTSMGPATYIMRMPPPPVCARTEPRTYPQSICPH